MKITKESIGKPNAKCYWVNIVLDDYHHNAWNFGNRNESNSQTFTHAYGSVSEVRKTERMIEQDEDKKNMKICEYHALKDVCVYV